jgi:two-component sensor histidine kinase
MRTRNLVLGTLVLLEFAAAVVLLIVLGIIATVPPVTGSTSVGVVSVAALAAAGLAGAGMALGVGAAARTEEPPNRKDAPETVQLGAANENESRLREIHHRVKNNLQILFSMTNIQKLKSNSEEAELAYVDCQNRIKAVGLIHEMLHESRDLTLIDLRTYLERLAGYVVYSYGLELLNFQATVSGPEVLVTMKQAIPSSMIFVELLTNTAKHAVPDTPSCRVHVDLDVRDGWISMRYADNGPGLPQEPTNAAEGSFGLKLIRGLVDQLEGRSEIATEGGLRFDLRFPVYKTP